MKYRKIVLIKFSAGQQWRNRHTEQTYTYEGGEEEKGAIYGESNMETYITICKIDSQREFTVWLRELKQGLCNKLKGGLVRETGGRFGKEGT